MKKQFFRLKFIMFISLTLIPICIFGFISVFFINMKVKQEAEAKTMAITDLMEQSFSELTNTLEFYRVTMNSDAQLHLALIQALNNEHLDMEMIQRLEQSMQNIYYSQSTKPYIQSLYITMQDSPYYINGLNRERFSDSIDKNWAGIMDGREESAYIQIRHIKKNKFDTHTIPTVTVYQRMKYNELMAVNINQDYFNKWLNSVADYDGQVLMILSPDGQVLFFNKNAGLLPEDIKSQALAYTAGTQPDNLLLNGYYISSEIFPGNYGFRYVSMIPRSEVFELSNKILQLTIGAGLLSIFASSVLAYFFTRRDYQQIFQIIELFDQAEKGEFHSQNELKTVPNSPYFHIINNVIHLFMSQTYLNVQLDAKKYALSTAQLSALQYQLNPHFLFNTLQSIDLEILKACSKPTPANQMILELSSLLRYSLDAPMKPVTVQEEIAVTKNYIGLQSFKYRDCFHVTWEYSQDILDFPILRLLLQPIIENSIIHSGKAAPEKLWIKIKIRRNNGFLSFYIIDNGYGIDKKRLADLQQALTEEQVDSSGKHIGLKNISQRIRLAYKNGYVRLQSKKGMGTIVELGGIGYFANGAAGIYPSAKLPPSI